MQTALPGPRILGRAAVTEPAPEDPAPGDAGTETDTTDTPVSPGPFADLAAQLEAEASEYSHQAGAKRGEAAAVKNAAAAENQRRTAEADQQAQRLAGDADGDESHAAVRRERARLMTRAGALQGQAEATERRAETLAAEGERVAGEAAELSGLCAQYEAGRQAADGQLAAGREARDADAMTTARNRLASIAVLTADASGDLAKAQARASQIGDPDGPGELAQALDAARKLRADLWQVLGVLAEGQDEPGHAEVMQAVAAETARCAAVLAAERERVTVLASVLPGLLPPLTGEREELDRRLAEPVHLRTVDSSIALRQRSEDLDRFTAAVHGAISAASACLDRLADPDPAGLADVLAIARRTRQQIRRVLDTPRAPLAADDLRHPLEVLQDAARAMAEADEQPDPRPRHRVIPPLH